MATNFLSLTAMPRTSQPAPRNPHITSLGIGYLTISQNSRNFINWQWLQSLPTAEDTAYLRHVKLEHPVTVKIDGKKSRAVILAQKTP